MTVATVTLSPRLERSMGPSPGKPLVESKPPRTWCTGRRYPQRAPHSPSLGPLPPRWPGIHTVHAASAPVRLAAAMAMAAAASPKGCHPVAGLGVRDLLRGLPGSAARSTNPACPVPGDRGRTGKGLDSPLGWWKPLIRTLRSGSALALRSGIPPPLSTGSSWRRMSASASSGGSIQTSSGWGTPGWPPPSPRESSAGPAPAGAVSTPRGECGPSAVSVGAPPLRPVGRQPKAAAARRSCSPGESSSTGGPSVPAGSSVQPWYGLLRTKLRTPPAFDERARIYPASLSSSPSSRAAVSPPVPRKVFGHTAVPCSFAEHLRGSSSTSRTESGRYTPHGVPSSLLRSFLSTGRSPSPLCWGVQHSWPQQNASRSARASPSALRTRGQRLCRAMDDQMAGTSWPRESSKSRQSPSMWGRTWAPPAPLPARWMRTPFMSRITRRAPLPPAAPPGIGLMSNPLPVGVPPSGPTGSGGVNSWVAEIGPCCPSECPAHCVPSTGPPQFPWARRSSLPKAPLAQSTAACLPRRSLLVRSATGPRSPRRAMGGGMAFPRSCQAAL